MDWYTAAMLGAAGGALVEIIAVFTYLTSWQEARRRSREHNEPDLPPLDKYIDIPADTLVAITRLLLGAGAGLIFQGQVSGAAAAIAVGASAPAVLHQLGNLRSVRDAIQYNPPQTGEATP